ncbi:3-hydroxyacyl-CoA dehydrogenase [Halobacillus shinanisalinarum]|uniref:3-hydroxyacyl-CoA dehydrogenase n=1 Tax=Halobacillus shinanisalinarum TaxID=2932258 RepID=A0ABY4H5J1_9BACI|nr:3-hydroxyacyl-CoA dehydrogenase [Halobacillus shinanisalinarum]UOQ95370.1 3-hydroxyacyl-CoA dehydrogenase [Halobacillus shinanisalinarum]
MDVRDVVAVVTGGASGLGEATVRTIVGEGGRAIIVDRDLEKGRKLAEELGTQVLFQEVDVTSEQQVSNMLNKTIAYFGKVTALVNCAGVAIGEKVLNREGVHGLASFQKVVEVNLIGTFNMIRLVSERMKENVANDDGERGVVVNTASIAAFEGQIGQAAYSASKSGVVGLTLPISRELARHGIRVMTIAPGLFDTPMFETLPDSAKELLGETTPFPKRLGHPCEYGKLVHSIIDNPMLNGEVIRLDGAIRMQPK